jgi:phage anti-repressor protein
MMDTLQFLKKYTPVDGIFIDDFFSLYDLESNQSSCVINLEVVAKWLESTKAGLTKTLKESYVNGVDYTITKTIQQPNNGRTLNAKKTVLISPDCLKRICMLSRSKNAEKLRTYFLITEKSLFNYKNEIMEGMNSRIGILENNQKSKRNLPVGGVIYIIAASDSMNSRFKLQRALRYKIGKTKDARTRLRSHSSASADNIKVV